MVTFVLVRANGLVSPARSPRELDFAKVAGEIRYVVRVCFGDFLDPDEPLYLIATVDLTGCMAQADWTARQLCDEIDFRRTFPGFEDEVKSADGPLITFGELNTGSNGDTV